MRTLLGLVVALCVGAAGCDDAEPIGCDWFEGSDNCWKPSVAEANACVDESFSPGTISVDRRTCTYADGVTIAFEDPLPMSTSEDYLWRFEIRESGGGTCASFHEEETGGVRVTTARGEFVEQVDGFEIRMTCPEGGTYKIDGFDAIECGFSVLPGFSWAAGGFGVSFSLVGGETNETLFSCEEPVASR